MNVYFREDSGRSFLDFLVCPGQGVLCPGSLVLLLQLVSVWKQTAIWSRFGPDSSQVLAGVGSDWCFSQGLEVFEDAVSQVVVWEDDGWTVEDCLSDEVWVMSVLHFCLSYWRSLFSSCLFCQHKCTHEMEYSVSLLIWKNTHTEPCQWVCAFSTAVNSIMHLGTQIVVIKHMVIQTPFYQIRRDLIKWTLHGDTLKQPICRPTLSLWPHLHQALACVFYIFTFWGCLGLISTTFN